VRIEDLALIPSPSPTGEGSRIQSPSPVGEGFRVRARSQHLNQQPIQANIDVMTESEILRKIAGSGRSIPHVSLERAQELRKQQTPTEQIMWECLRDQRFLNTKFRRQHNIGQFVADFYCHSTRLVIELGGEIHHSQKVEDTNRDE
jgi:hypothetical protein